MKENNLIGVAVAAVLLAAPPFAHATQYLLNTPNTGLIGQTGPYGQVDVTLNGAGTVATITFTALTQGTNTYKFGGGQAVDVNVNTGESSIQVAVTTPGSASVGNTPQNVSTFGSMNVSIDNTDGSGDATTPFTFTVTRTSGTWASSGSVLTPDNQGFLAAAHIFVYQNGVNNAALTGFAGNGGTPSVPDSGTVAGLLGGGLLALAALRRRFGVA